MKTSKFKIDIEDAKTAKLCYCDLIIVHFGQALDEQQVTVNFLQWKNDNNPNASNMHCLDFELS